MLWNHKTVSEATGGEVFGQWQANAVCLDTRKLNQGDIFIAFKGEKLDGHDMVAGALDKGAAAAMVEYIPKDVDKSKLILVKNCAKALEDLAIYNRARLKAKIIAITGSVGKTSTKEAAFLAFSELGESFMTKGNYNNNLGLPITMASIPLSTKYAVLEMGMNSPGEITYLTNLAEPDVAIITNIAGVHLEYFGSIEEIAKAKCEIFAGLSKDGAAILNRESKYFDLQCEYAKKAGVANVLGFAQDYEVKEKIIKAKILGEFVEYKLAAYGAHHVVNSLAVLTAVKFLGGELAKAINGLAKFNNVKGRGEVSQVKLANKEIIIIDDSYNASPVAVRAALAVLGNDFANAKRKLAILADMRELGANAVDEHIGLKEAIIANKIDKLIAVGPLMNHLFDAIPASIQLKCFANTEEALDNVVNYLEDGDVVLVKGSHGTGLYKLIDYLKEQK